MPGNRISTTGGENKSFVHVNDKCIKGELSGNTMFRMSELCAKEQLN